MRNISAALLAFTLGAAPLLAQEVEVDVELVLAVDISRSMDMEELRIQRQGYVAALRDPRVHTAIGAGMLGRIAISYVEWAGAGKREQVIPWTLIDSPEAALEVADALDVHPLAALSGTSISDALAWSARSMARNGFRGLRRVIDVSGDGPNNTGARVDATRDRVLAEGIVINGLPLMMKAVDGPFSLRALDIYYEDCVIGGPRSFLLPVVSLDTFAETIRRKLILEIALADPTPAPIPVQMGLSDLAPAPRIDCLIGEKKRDRWLRESGWE